MIDPITGLPTPFGYLGGRQVLGGFPVPGYTGGWSGAASQAIPAAQSLPGAFGGPGSAYAALPQQGGGFAALQEANALGGMGGSRGLAGQLGRFAPVVSNPEASGLMRYVAPGLTGRAALGRVGGYGLLGSAGSNIVDRFDIGGNQSNWEQGLQGAAQGAGLGAGIGSVVPVIGTGVGAAAGGVIGGAVGVLANIFGGDKKDKAADPRQIIGAAITQAQLDPQTTAKILDTYAVQMTFAKGLDGKDAQTQAENAALQQTSSMILTALQQRQQNTAMTQGMSGPSMLALQAQAQQVFEPIASGIESTGAAYTAAMDRIRGSLPAEYRAINEADTARQSAFSSNLADAYRAQAAMTPMIQRITQYQQDQQSFANQLFQQQQAQLLQQMYSGGGSSGSSQDLSALLQPTG